MPRIRSIKPEFWTDEVVGECSPTARLLFIGTWVIADDYGNLERSARQLGAQLFPYDKIDCEPLLQELISKGRLIEYEVNGSKYLHIYKFSEHQKIEKKSKARHPLYEESLSAHRTVGDYSPTTPQPLRIGGGGEVELEVEGNRRGWGSTDTPTDLTQLEYARMLLDVLGMPASGNLHVVADAISAEAKFSNTSKAKAFELIRDAALQAQKDGVEITRFWFQDAKWRQPKKAEKKPQPTLPNPNDKLKAWKKRMAEEDALAAAEREKVNA